MPYTKSVMICGLDSCDDQAFQRGYCPRHYMKWYRGSLVKRTCIHDGCTEPVRTETNGGKRCQQHHDEHHKQSRMQYNNQRRVAVGLAPIVTNDELIRLDNGRCYICQGELVGELHRDHIRPVVRGGDNDVSNLALVHAACNHKKSDADPSNLSSRFPLMRLPDRFVVRVKAGWKYIHRMTKNDERFLRIYQEVINWYESHGHIPRQNERMEDDFKIGAWVNRVRQSKKNNKLVDWQRAMLEELEWWRW